MPPKADRGRAVQAARELLENAKVVDAPVDPFAIARGMEIVLQPIDKENVDFSGCLLREGQVWGILYRNDINVEGFKRFTVAHELGHHEMTHHHDAIFANGNLHASQSNFTSNLWHEQEADCFAAELLMPSGLFTAAIHDTTIGLPAIKSLSDRFLTSLTSTAIRYAGLSHDPVAIIVSERSCILYCFTSPCMRTIRADYIERATRVPAGTETDRHFKSSPSPGDERQGRSYLSAWFEKPTRDLEFNEDVIDLGRYGKVLTVLHATEIPDEEEIEELDMEEDAEANKFNRDGKRISW
jgi:hypothetical protein